MTQITRDSLNGEAAATGKRARPRTRTRSISRTRTKKRTTSLVVLALLSAIGAASVAVDAAASTAATAVPRSRSKFHSNSNSNVYHNSNSNFDSNSNLNLKLASPSFYSPQNKVVITKSSEQLELEQRLHRLKGDADDSDDDDDRQQHQQEFITSFYRRKREEHLKTTTAGRANAYDEFGNRRRRRDRREGSQTSLCSIHQSAAVRGGAVRSASASSSISSTALFGGLGQDRGQDRRGQGLCDQDRGQDRRDLHHRPRSKHASDASKSASSPSHTQSSATARRDAQFPEDLDSTYDGNDGDDDDDNSGGDYFPSSLSGDDNVDNNGSTSASSTDGGGGLGLLRVPCSIAINSNEDARSHHSHSHHHHLDHSHHRHHGVGNHGLGHSSSYSHDHHVKKTPIAAYVDTGAQVTVISASAARRAGILHLMDRRYAGRATGVGHCKVLGRIPARHVYFILGDGGDTAHGKADVKCHWDDPHGEDDYRDDGHNYSEDSSTVQMEGPALTVLEGTVTQGVDVLLGLDVLQDWEAEIRMGPNKSITVRKWHGRTGSGGGSAATDVAITDKLVIPFVNENYGDRNGFLSHSSRRRRHQHLSHRGGHDRRAPSVAPPENHHSKASLHHPTATSRSRGVDHTHGNYGMSRRHGYSRHHHHHPDHHHGHHPSLSLEDEEQEQEAEDDDFSPTASDVESDLDMLEHSFTTCKTASATILGRASTTPTSSSESNLGRGSLDERLFEEDADNDDNVNYDDDDDYLQEDDDLVDEDDLGDFDMSGL